MGEIAFVAQETGGAAHPDSQMRPGTSAGQPPGQLGGMSASEVGPSAPEQDAALAQALAAVQSEDDREEGGDDDDDEDDEDEMMILPEVGDAICCRNIEAHKISGR